MHFSIKSDTQPFTAVTELLAKVDIPPNKVECILICCCLTF